MPDPRVLLESIGTVNVLMMAEALIVLLVLAVALSAPWLRRRSTLARIERLFARVARSRARAVLIVGLSALIGRAVLMPLVATPEPGVMDEYAHLLAADTFLQGRVTNAPHPLWQHFETMHVNQQPTYQSMYPPAQGAVLALGRMLGGHAWVGVWLSVSLMCAAICWMLQGWLPPGWAFLGGMLCVLRLGLFSYWMNSYWGGAVAATGGALVLGALPRLLRRAGVSSGYGVVLAAGGAGRWPVGSAASRVGIALLMGAGLVLLATTRPFEGMLTALPAAALLLWSTLALRGAPLRRMLGTVMAPLALVLAVAAAGLGYYNWRGTGDALTMPQQVNWKTYRSASQFLFQPPKAEPSYRHPSMQTFYRWELTVHESGQGLRNAAAKTASRFRTFWMFFVGAALTLPLVWLPRVLRDRRVRPLLAVCALTWAGVLVETWGFPHYWSPLTGAFYAVALQSMRHLRAAGARGPRWGRPALHGIVAACVVVAAARAAVAPLLPSMPPPHSWPMSALLAETGQRERAALLERLRAEHPASARHLIIVRYAPNHYEHDEWVYNEADLDAARVVWAREMSPERNAALLVHFHDRHVWLLEPDEARTLTPYAPPGPVDAQAARSAGAGGVHDRLSTRPN